MVVVNIRVLNGVAWSFLQESKSVLVLRSAIVLQLAPPNCVPVDVTNLLEFLPIGCLKLV